MKFLISLCWLLLLSISSSAALPSSRFIVLEWVKNSGNGVYQIEQDVQFPTAGEPLVLRETWWVENENTLRLQVTGLRELKDQFHLQFVYQGGQRTGLGPNGRVSKKISEDMIEKYFHYRSMERLLNDLHALKVLPKSALHRKTLRSLKDVDDKPEALVRLGRTGGTTAYTFGLPSALEGNANPGFWIEQDTFLLRKFRLPSLVEVSADKFSQSTRGLMFPRVRTVSWASNSLQIQTINVASKTGLRPDFFQPSSLEAVNRMDGIQNPALKSLVEEFYLRFR